MSEPTATKTKRSRWGAEPPAPVDGSAAAAVAANVLAAAEIAKVRALEIARRLGGGAAGGGGGGYTSAVATGSNDTVLGKRIRSDDGAAYPVGDGSKHHRSDGSTQLRKRIFVPADEHPDVNWISLIRHYQPQIEVITNTRVALRGRNSGSDDKDSENEDLHVLVFGDTDEQITRGATMVEEVLTNDAKRAAHKRSYQITTVALTGQPADRKLELMAGLYSADTQNVTAASIGLGYGSRASASLAEKKKVIEVSGDRIGLVIGKGGETIKKLQTLTNCHIQVAKESTGSTTRTITLSGSEREIALCEDEINRIITGQSSALPAQRGGMPDGTPRGNSGTAGLGFGAATSGPNVMQIPNNVVGLLIGRAGENIKILQQRTGCNIQVTRDTDMPPGSQLRPVHLIGNPEQVNAAKAEINVLVAQQAQKDAAAGMMGGGGGGGGGGGMPGVSQPMGGGNSFMMKVPNANVGIVIGKGGENIRALQMKTGARIQMSRDQGAPEREVTISGSQQQIDMAKYEIMALIGQAGPGRGMVNVQFGPPYGGSPYPMNGMPQGGGGGGGGWDPQQQAWQQAGYQDPQQYAQWMAYYGQQGGQGGAGGPQGSGAGAPTDPSATAATGTGAGNGNGNSNENGSAAAAPQGASGAAPTGAPVSAPGLSPYPPTMDFTSPEYYQWYYAQMAAMQGGAGAPADGKEPNPNAQPSADGAAPAQNAPPTAAADAPPATNDAPNGGGGGGGGPPPLPPDA